MGDVREERGVRDWVGREGGKRTLYRGSLGGSMVTSGSRVS